MQKLSQRIALICGGLCLGLSLLLVLVSHLSSRHILEQQNRRHDEDLTMRLAEEINPVIAQGDLIRLEVLLNAMLERHDLQLVSVRDLDDRPLGHAGGELTADSVQYRAPLKIDQHIAGEVIAARRNQPALLDHRHMTLGLLGLAVLTSVFAAAIARHWGQGVGRRLEDLHGQLSRESVGDTDEIAALEKAVRELPLDLLRSDGDEMDRGQEFEQAGLLYIRLESLTRYVAALDEQSLLNYTRRLQDLVEACAGLYAGQVSVCREFGLLVLFSGAHASGSPAIRCLSCAWLLRRLAADLGKSQALKYQLGLACALGEASRCAQSGVTGGNIYPDLYNQHIVNDLATLALSAGERIVVSDGIAQEEQVEARCRLDGAATNAAEPLSLSAFEEPHADALERQARLLLQKLGGRSQTGGESAGGWIP